MSAKGCPTGDCRKAQPEGTPVTDFASLVNPQAIAAARGEAGATVARAEADAASMRLRLGRHDDLASLAEEVRTRGLARHDLAEAGNAAPPESRLPASAPPARRLYPLAQEGECPG